MDAVEIWSYNGQETPWRMFGQRFRPGNTLLCSKEKIFEEAAIARRKCAATVCDYQLKFFSFVSIMSHINFAKLRFWPVSTNDQEKRPDLLHSLTEIVASYLKINTLPADQVPPFIEAIYAVLNRAVSAEGGAVVPAAPEPVRPAPAVPIDESVTDDYIICLEDGKRLRMLKRYLSTHYRMTPEEYRSRWSLPANYPMVAPSYAASKAAFAKRIGLGRRSRRGEANGSAAPASAAPSGRGRPRSAPVVEEPPKRGRRRSAG
ncbi:MAG TPA: MucR family transcriptional regulator [Stellaceae bacterium]